MTSAHDMPFGAAVLPGGGVRFRLWAPGAAHVDLEFVDPAGASRQRMARDEGGWHEWIEPGAAAGTRYRFVLPDGLAVPDPASRGNPDGVHAASEVVDPAAHAWTDADWVGRPWHEAVVYELHVGTFTSAGTYLSAIERLADLAALGVTAIELMPLAAFPGERGWGYDGVLPFAPQASYGTPADLRQLVQAAHGLGLMVLVDVVYNHFGPEGNYLHAYCPEFFNPAHQTPWGAAINFDGENHAPVRDFFVHNALYWVEEFHVDGLRMDAVHAIRDDSAEHICEEIGQALRAFGLAQQPPRHVHLVLENDANDALLLERDEQGVPVSADAQWNDDLHHAAHVLATGEVDGYYVDYAERPLARFGRTLAEGFDYQGEPSALRGGEPRGEPSAHLPSVAFISFLQNHDQIGNRAFGERIATLVDGLPGGSERLEALSACVLLAPAVPMLFMGEEFGATTPFLYFCDFGPELAAAVSKGRREEFERFAAFRDEGVRARVPDANDAASFTACKLDWPGRDASWLAATRERLALRARHLVPRLARPTLGGSYRVEGDLLQVEWVLGDGSVWHVALNLGEADAPLPASGQTVLALRADAMVVRPNGLRVSIESTDLAAVAAAQASAAIEDAQAATEAAPEAIALPPAVSSTPDPEPA